MTSKEQKTTVLPAKESDKMSDEKLIAAITTRQHAIGLMTKEIKKFQAVLLERYNDKISDALTAKDEPWGTVNVTINNGEHKLSAVIPRKVEWDQAKLEQLFGEIKENWGDEPTDYIDVEYSISESQYSNWPPMLQGTFKDARTVSYGNASVKIAEVK